jgi:branched-chain amino acid transport system permease protein
MAIDRRILLFIGVVAWLAFPAAFSTDSVRTMAVFASINLIQAIGLSLLFGYTGQISLGQAGFYGIGAYASSLAATRLGVPPAIGLVIATAAPAALAYLIGRPILRLKGYYLAMVTAGMGLILHTVFVEWDSLTGGYSGVVSIPPIALGPLRLNSPLAMYFAASALAGFLLWQAHRIVNTSYGGAMRTTRESEAAARSVGIDVAGLKAEVFAIAAGMSGLAGGLYAHYVGFVSPESFTLDVSINLLLALVIGGIGSLWGAAMGAVLLTFLPEWLHQLQNAYGLVFGALLILVLTIEPGGLFGLARKLVRGRAS